MRILIVVLLIFATHFSLTALVPATPGHAWIGWPFAVDTKPWLAVAGEFPQHSGGSIAPILAGIAGLALLGALFSLFRVIVPAGWWSALVVIGAIASLVLYILYFGVFSILPLVVDVILLWGIFAQHWSVAVLNDLG